MFITGKRLINLNQLFVRKQFIMPVVSSEDLKQLEHNLNVGQKLISQLKDEIKTLMTTVQKQKEQSKIKALKNENQALMKEINCVKSNLISLQVANGISQIPIPGDDGKPTSCNHLQAENASVKATIFGNVLNSEPASKENKPPKAVKAKKPAGTAPPSDDLPIDVGRLDIRVGKVLNVKVHPDADQLYIEQIDVGEDKSRTVVSGLVRYVPLAELEHRAVLVMCNLKPAKMRGVISEAMVLCASGGGAVELLSPPPAVAAGDTVAVPGYPRRPDLPFLNPKKKIFEQVAEDLVVDGEKRAAYKGVPWVVEGREGHVTVQSLAGCHIK